MKKIKGYYQKVIKFSGQDLKLYSLDGVTWSSKQQELIVIEERQIQQQQSVINYFGPK